MKITSWEIFTSLILNGKKTTLAGHCRTNRRSGHDTIAGHRTIVALTHVQCVSLDFCISGFRSRVRRATPIVYIASHYIVRFLNEAKRVTSYFE